MSTEEQGNAASPSATILIAGANRGIGLELARQYVESGWNVIGTARDPEHADALRALDLEVLQLDVSDAGSVERLARALAGRSIDVLIMNAGIQKLMLTLDAIDLDKFEESLRVNTLGPVRVICALLPNLRAGQHRKIISMTSELGSIAGNASGGFYGYRESKVALNMFMKSLSVDLAAEGFICVAMHPGWVKTDMGGPRAPLEVTASVTGLRRVIGALGPSDNGSYLTYDGKALAW